MMAKNVAPRRTGLLDRQFGHPSGLLGALVGEAMAIEHKTLHRQVVDRLSLHAGDRVLEIGFGPGTALRLAARKAEFAAGIDPSPAMVRQAVRRNRRAIESGRVQVVTASASSIPFATGSFSVVFEVHSYHHWDRPEAGLKEAFRVLKAGGRLLMTLRGGRGGNEPAMREADGISRVLRETGFRKLRVEEHHSGHGGVILTAAR